eukprot:GSMAST32.ASY1.ANO1.1550.1 assembled CDS
MTGKALSAREAELYDRQIRLWGVHAQQRMLSSHVLLVGLSGLHTETAKNLVLAGVNVTVADNRNVTASDTGVQYFVTPTDIGVNRVTAALPRIQALNPMATVKAVPTSLESKNVEFFKQFSVVSLSGCSCTLVEQMRINDICRANNIVFYASDTVGYFGQIFADLGKHSYVKTNGKGGTIVSNAPIEVVYPSLREACEQASWSQLHSQMRWGLPVSFFVMQAWQQYKHNNTQGEKNGNEIDDFVPFAQKLFMERNVTNICIPSKTTLGIVAELVPVCAVLAGILSQDIIKAISGRDEPIRNFFSFDALQSDGNESYVAENFKIIRGHSC